MSVATFARVPVRRLAQPVFRGYRERVVVPEIIRTIERNQEVEVDFGTKIFGVDWDNLLVETERSNEKNWKVSPRVKAMRIAQTEVPVTSMEPNDWAKTAGHFGMTGDDLVNLFDTFDKFITQVFNPYGGVGMGGLKPGLYRYFGELFGYTSAESLEEALSDIRDDHVLDEAKAGGFGFMPGAREFLTALSQNGWMRGLVTANARRQVTGLLNEFLGRERADEVLPPRYRLFGREESQKNPSFCNKPSPHILEKLADLHGGKIVDVIVVDDRLDMIKQSVLARVFAAIWVTPDVLDEEKFKPAMTDLQRSLGPRLMKRVVIAPSLEHVLF